MKKPRGAVRLLVVEDDATNQEVALRILQHLGYDGIEIAPDGRRALAILARRDFDLVLMDCHLPDMDGYEISRRIRERDSAVRNHEIPIVATTAAAMESDRAKCLAAGMNGYVSKPLRLDTLNRAIEEWTGAAGIASAAFDQREIGESVMGNEDLARRIVCTFVNDIPRQLARLALAVSEGDAHKVRLVAHAIKGAASSVSGQEIREASSKLEQCGSDGNLAGAVAALGELSKSFERAKPLMESFCQGRPDGAGSTWRT